MFGALVLVAVALTFHYCSSFPARSEWSETVDGLQVALRIERTGGSGGPELRGVLICRNVDSVPHELPAERFGGIGVEHGSRAYSTTLYVDTEGEPPIEPGEEREWDIDFLGGALRHPGTNVVGGGIWGMKFVSLEVVVE